MDIRLIALDLDGTLLDKDKQISSLNAEALRLCEARGMHVVLSSGRSFESVRKFCREVGLKSPIISSNGARVDASLMGPVWLELPIPETLSWKVMRLLDESGLHYELYHKNKLFIINGDEQPGQGYETKVDAQDGFVQERILDHGQMEREGVPFAYKYVIFSHDYPALDRLHEQLLEIEHLNINSSWRDNVEVMAEHAGKGSCLKYLAGRLGLSRDQIMAFGDNLNDLDMLQYAGWPVVMENGLEEIKPVARIIAPHHDRSGVGRVLMERVLGGEEAAL